MCAGWLHRRNSSIEIFGRKLSELVNDGIKSKINMMPDKAKLKLQESLQKIVNTGSGGLIAIIL